MTPVKITSSERRTATQLRMPPTTAATNAASTRLTSSGTPTAVAEDRRRVAADARQRADAQEQLAGAAEDDVERDRVGGEEQSDGGHAHRSCGSRRTAAGPGEHGAGRRRSVRTCAAMAGAGEAERPGAESAASRSCLACPEQPAGRSTIVIAAAPQQDDRRHVRADVVRAHRVDDAEQHAGQERAGTLPSPPTTATMRARIVKSMPALTVDRRRHRARHRDECGEHPAEGEHRGCASTPG